MGILFSGCMTLLTMHHIADEFGDVGKFAAFIFMPAVLVFCYDLYDRVVKK